MLRVPGSAGDLFQIKALGGDVRVVYSPLDCLKLARANPDETGRVLRHRFRNHRSGQCHVGVAGPRAGDRRTTRCWFRTSPCRPPWRPYWNPPRNRVQAFLGAGHVCAVMGWEEYEPLAARYRVPIVVTGFEPVDLLEGILMAVRQLESGRYEVENQYARAVRREGNLEAERMIARVFEPCDRAWRGIGVIPGSGYRLREEFAAFDAARLFDVGAIVSQEPAECISGLVLQGARRPLDCPAFGTQCTPETPLGATMVSAEGACAAYYNYGRRLRQPMNDFTLSCPLPITDRKTIVLGHGSGGKLSAQLIREMFLPAFDNPLLNRLDDQAVLEAGGARIAFTTDSFVVTPLFFPGRRYRQAGGPRHHQRSGHERGPAAGPSAAFILEEGFAMEDLGAWWTPWRRPPARPAFP